MENSLELLKEYTVTTFYRFQPLAPAQLEELRESLQAKGESLGLCGLFLIGPEGLNATVAGRHLKVSEYKDYVQSTFGGETFFFKDSMAYKNPFRLMRVKIREEIVTLGRPDLVPYEGDGHLSPEEWHKWLEREDVQVIDTRNTYEYQIGKFKNALTFEIEHFQDFPEHLKSSGVDKEKPVLIYCTGGIRCEKAILEMQEQGFKEVKQLEGGILNYLEKFPEGHFEGECFVFDHRVAVDKNLEPSNRYTLCPHCGQPSDQWIECKQCGTSERVCQSCLDKDKNNETCSKNCAHHYSKGHKTTRLHLDELKKRGRI